MDGGTRRWLMKSEPQECGIADLERDGRVSWTGVRNYQARNLMRDAMRVGDLVLFYHSSVEPPGVAGVGRVVCAAAPDPTQYDRASPYFDARARPGAPVWVAVEIAFVEAFPRLFTLGELRAEPLLRDMLLLRRGQRLSVQPVGASHFDLIVRRGRRLR